MEAVDTRVMQSSDVLNKVFIKLFPLVKRKLFSAENLFKSTN
jgi:hypothetical protein